MLTTRKGETMKQTQETITIGPEDLQGRHQVWIDFGIDIGEMHISLHPNGGSITCWLNKRIKSVQRRTYRY